MEVGRHSVIGPGELWMGTEDPLIAQNMHTTIIGYVQSISYLWFVHSGMVADDFMINNTLKSSSSFLLLFKEFQSYR